MRINKEGYKIIGISGAVCLLLWWLFYHLLVHDANVSLLWFSTLVLLLFWFFIVAFFREPRRALRLNDHSEISITQQNKVGLIIPEGYLR